MSFTLPSHPSWVLLRLGERALGDGSGCQLLSISKGPYHQQLERGGSFGPLQLHVSSNMELPKGHSNGENDVLNHAIYLSTLLSVGFLTSNAPKTYLLDAWVHREIAPFFKFPQPMASDDLSNPPGRRPPHNE